MSTPVPAGMVRILPLPGNMPEGVASKVQDVDPETAERLTGPRSRHDAEPRFVTDPALLPEGWVPPDPDGLLADDPTSRASRRTRKPADAPDASGAATDPED
jgi:hypothetical protein